MIRTLRAEWTKFRTVRGWMIGMVVAALLTVGIGAFSASGNHASCSAGPVEVPCPTPPIGPEGQAVTDHFYFVHRQLAGDGTITARVNSMTGKIRKPDVKPGARNEVAGLTPWAKAGVMIKQSARPGSAYAAVMVTAQHGVRMQHNFTHDVAGRPGGVARWLRMTRAGDTITGFESADGANWTKVDTVRLAELPQTVEIGLFAASPGEITVTQGDIGGTITAGRFAEATAVFDQVGIQGRVPGGQWRHDDVGASVNGDGSVHHPGRAAESGGTFSVTGVGDIGPADDGRTVESTFTGLPAGLIVVIVVAVVFVTAEYRRGLIRTSLLSVPRRGRMLAAKALVIAAVTFVAGLAATAGSAVLGTRILRANGNYVLPVSMLTEVRVVAGVAAFLALVAVFVLALGALFRRSAVAVTLGLVAIVVPHLLATSSVFPLTVSQWLLRVTPAAGFAIQQSIPEYPQVLGYYSPQGGYYPLAPWAGLVVLGAFAALALGLAVYRLNRRDA
ncbi:ABC transporter permease subunit [Nonomuraea sediminis]|uniref:ABC transporter permease subunit n=1 Tax=Nonomuraea sediminis TaxID=2835864 RepID=UPI001BDC50CA|nr:ABC transporter permease subunit [Nonomuraea sediminis]